MNTPDEFKKMKYHISQLSESLLTYEARFTQLIIKYDFSEEQVSDISDVFNNYLSKTNPNWESFELELSSFTQDPQQLIQEYTNLGLWTPTTRRYNAYMKEKQHLEEAISDLS